MKMLKQQLGERRNAAEREAVDFFDVVIDEMDRPGSEMSESIALDLLFLMLFASHETTSIGLTAILKFLTDNPKTLQELAVTECETMLIMPSIATCMPSSRPEHQNKWPQDLSLMW